jgi:hypothetical protein
MAMVTSVAPTLRAYASALLRAASFTKKGALFSSASASTAHVTSVDPLLDPACSPTAEILTETYSGKINLTPV